MKKLYDFIRAYWRHVIGVDAYVILQNPFSTIFDIIKFAIVLMAVKHNGAFVETVPFGNRIMAQDEFRIAARDFCIILYGNEQRLLKFSAVRKMIMIAPDEMFFDAQRLEAFGRNAGPFHGKIAENIDVVFRRNPVIPFLLQNAVHLFHAVERPMGMDDDFFMPKMQISCKIGHLSFFPRKIQ